MAPLQLRLLWVMIICVVFVGCVSCARDQKTNNTISKEHREKKAHLVKKYLKRLKKPEGLVRLVDGRGEYEGKLMQVTVRYRAPTVLNFYCNTVNSKNYNSRLDAMFIARSTNITFLFHQCRHQIRYKQRRAISVGNTRSAITCSLSVMS